MKICFISDYLEGGGAEIYMRALIKMLKEKGHQVFLIIDEELNEVLSFQEINVYKVPFIRKPEDTDEFLDFAQITQESFKLIWDILSHERPHLIHVHNIFNPFLLNVIVDSEIPTVKTLHDVRPFASKVDGKLLDENDFETNWGKSMLQAFPKFSKIFVFSKFLKQLVESGDPQLKHTISLLSPFSPIKVLSQADQLYEKSTNGLSYDIDVLFLGRICYEKGAYEIIELAKSKEFENFKFVMAGLSLDSQVERLVQKQDNIIIEDFLSPARVAQIISKCKLLVFPSIANETLGFSVIDALSFGKPVIAYDTGAVKELILHDKTGFLVKKGDKEDLKTKVLELLQDDTLRDTRGQNAKKFSQQRFNPAVHLDELLSGYKEALL